MLQMEFHFSGSFGSPPAPQLELTFTILFLVYSIRIWFLLEKLEEFYLNFFPFIQIWFAEKNYQFFHQVHKFFMTGNLSLVPFFLAYWNK